MVKKFVENTKDGQRVELLDVFELEREGEASGFNPLKLDNHKLLWHVDVYEFFRDRDSIDGIRRFVLPGEFAILHVWNTTHTICLH